MDNSCRTESSPGNAMPSSSSQFPFVSSGLVLSLVALTLSTVCVTCSQNSDVIPPVIIEGPPPHKIYNPKGTISLPCVGWGSMPLRFIWFRNEKELISHQKLKIGEDGSLYMNEPEEGYYQCKVHNIAGMALSNITHLQAAVCEVTPGRPNIRRVVKVAGQSLLLHCSHVLRSIPSAIITWTLNDTPVQLDEHRVSITGNGSLVFSYLLESDSNIDERSYYRCVAYNSITKREYGGSYYNLNVSRGDVEKPDEAPELVYSSESVVSVLQGQELSLLCIFGGSPTLMVEWLLPNGSVVESRRLDVPSTTLSDQGSYICRGKKQRNTILHTTEKTIEVTINDLPRVIKEPMEQMVKRGSTVYFSCQGLGRPIPAITWFVNGTEYNSSESDVYDSSVLWLHNVQDCASISCNISNKYGYHLYSTYLIVVDVVATTSSQGDMTSRSRSSTKMNTTYDDLQLTDQPHRVSSVISRSSSTVSSSTTNLFSNGSEGAQQKNPKGSDQDRWWIYILVVLPTTLISLGIIAYCYCRWKRKTQKYSLNDQKTEQGLELGPNRENDANCDSDDSGYDERKPGARLKHTKRLSDTPEEDSYL